MVARVKTTTVMVSSLVTAGAMLMAAAPASADPAAESDVQAVREAPTGVVALGDSYSSGLGVGTSDDECDRNAQAWGFLIFDDAVPAGERAVLACSGAVIDDVYEQLDELAVLGSPGGRLVTLTVGGNDVGFAGELARCFVPFVGCTGREDVIMERIEALDEPLTELYLAVQATVPGDELIVGGYPLLVPDPDVRSSCRALTSLLSADERHMIRRLGVALNEVIEEAARSAGVRSAGAVLEEVFDGHEACDNGPEDWLNGLRISTSSGDTEDLRPGSYVEFELDDSVTPPPGRPDATGDPGTRWEVVATYVRDSFHPNAAGQAGYADAFAQVWAGAD